MRSLLEGPIGRRLAAGGLGAVTWACSAATVSAEMAFRTHREVPVGTAPTCMARLDLDGPGLAVGCDEGIMLFGSRQEGLERTGRITSVSFVKSLDVGDVTQDGRPDIVCVAGRSNAVTILPGRDGGSFGEPFDVELEDSPATVKIRVFNKQGDVAVFVVHDRGATVLLPSSGRSFRKLLVPSIRAAADLDVADLDGDAVPDLVVAEMDRVTMLSGKGDGTYGAMHTLDDRDGGRRLHVQDVDGDKRPDVLVVSERGLKLNRASDLGTSNGKPGDAAVLVQPIAIIESAELSDLSLADLDGNGYPDIAATDSERGTVTVLMGKGGGHFGLAESYVTGRGPQKVLLGDFTRDGTMDAVVLNHVGDSVALLPGVAGGFRSSRSLLADARDLSAIAVGDFNGDGYLDIAVVSEESGTVILFTGNGHGSFSTHSPLRVGSQPRGTAAGRFRSGAVDDLAVADFGADEVVILEGGAVTPFRITQRLAVGEGPSPIVAGAFTLKNRVDIAVGNQISSTVSILRNDGSGRFEVREVLPVETEPAFLLLGDMNRDGRLDLLAGNDRGDTVAVLAGTLEGFAPAKTDQLGDRARPLVAEDFGGDGHVDLVLADESADVVEILPATGRGGFGLPLRLPVGPHPETVAAGDFDEDGLLDLAVLHPRGRTVSILINTGKAATRR